MPIFKFQGRDQKGKLISGTRFAQSADNLSAHLLNEGTTPIAIKLQKENTNIFKELKQRFERKKVTNNELSLFTRQIYTLIKAGVPIISAIKHLSANSRSAYFSQVLTGITEKLESGQNIAAAMDAYPTVFSDLVVGMVRVGQNSGRLDEAFLHLTEYLELEGATAKKIKTAMRYPIFVLCAITIGIVIINIFVIPTFSRIYKQANIDLPLMTRWLIAFSDFCVEYGKYILFVFVVLVIMLVRYVRTPQGRYLKDKALIKIPIIGQLLKRILLQRFTQTFAIVVNSGIPIIDGLTMTSESMTNRYARHEIIAMKESIQRGNSIVQAAYTCKLFTNLEIQMLAVSEETGDLGTMLREISLYYQREVDYDLKRLTDIIEPVLLIAIAIMVLLLALAVYMPMWSMVKLVHKA